MTKVKKVLTLVLSSFMMIGATVGIDNKTNSVKGESITILDDLTENFSLHQNLSNQVDYYQDDSIDQVYYYGLKSSSSSLDLNGYSNLKINAKLGGDTIKDDLGGGDYAIKACFIDINGENIGTPVVITNEITSTTGSDFSISVDAPNVDAYGIKVFHTKVNSYNVRYYSISLSCDIIQQNNSISYDANGGTGGPISDSIIENGSVTFANNTFVHAGYKFVCWNTKSDGSGTSYVAGQTYNNIDSGFTVYAIWSLDSSQWATITFNSNVSGNNQTSSQTVLKNIDTPLNANSFVNEGFNFKKWTTNSNGTGFAFSDKANISVNDDISLYAVWEKNPEVNLSSGIFDRSAGITTWSFSNGDISIVQSQGSGTDPVTLYISPARIYGGNILTFTASSNCYINQIDIYFNTSYRGGTLKVSNSCPYDNVIVNDSNNFDFKQVGAKCYTFTCKERANKQLIYIQPTENLRITSLKIYASYKFSINYFGNGSDSGSVTSQNVDNESLTTISQNGFIKDGFAFSHWNTEPDGTGVSYNPGDSIMPQEDLNLYAQWTEVSLIKVISLNDLYEGDQIVIAASNCNYAISTDNGLNFRCATPVGKKDDLLGYIGNDVEVYTLGEGAIEDTYSFKKGSMYLGSSGNNASYLKNYNELDAKTSWNISFDDSGNAKIMSNASGENIIRYKEADSTRLFTCFASEQYMPVSIYKIQVSPIEYFENIQTRAQLEIAYQNSCLLHQNFTNNETISENNTINGWLYNANDAYSTGYRSFRNNNESIQSPAFAQVNNVTVSIHLYLNDINVGSSKLFIEAFDQNDELVNSCLSENLNINSLLNIGNTTTFTFKLKGENITKIKITFLKDGGGDIAFDNVQVSSMGICKEDNKTKACLKFGACIPSSLQTKLRELGNNVSFGIAAAINVPNDSSIQNEYSKHNSSIKFTPLEGDHTDTKFGSVDSCVDEGKYYQFFLGISHIPESAFSTVFTACAYVCIDGTYYFAQESRFSICSLASEYVKEGMDTSSYDEHVEMLKWLSQLGN